MKPTMADLKEWLKYADGTFHYTNILYPDIEVEHYTYLKRLVQLAVQQKLIRPLGRKDGWYRPIKQVAPVRWHDADETQYFDLEFPKGHGGDDSSFQFESLIRVSPGDVIVIGGVSNTGKSALALNILGENVDKYPCLLMGNEYTNLDGTPSPKFKRRMMHMHWVNWLDGKNEPKFTLLPVRDNFEDYVEPGKLNIIDWIHLKDNFYQISRVIEDIKVELGNGVAVVVLQKGRGAEQAIGGQFTEHLADVYFTIDPYGDFQSRLTVGKVKDSRGKATGRMWAFKIVDGGANLHDIREIRLCHTCWGKGYRGGQPCNCDNGYIAVEP